MTAADDLAQIALNIHDAIGTVANGHDRAVTKEMMVIDTVSQLASMQYMREIRDLLTRSAPGGRDNPIDIRPDMADAWDQGFVAYETWRQDHGLRGSLKPNNPYREKS